MSKEYESAIKSLLADFNMVATFAIMRELSQSRDPRWATSIVDSWYERNLSSIQREYEYYINSIGGENPKMLQTGIDQLDTCKQIITEVLSSGSDN
jgi:hypothetical protein